MLAAFGYIIAFVFHDTFYDMSCLDMKCGDIFSQQRCFYMLQCLIG